MNRSKLKTYAIQARRDCIQAVTDKAAVYGLTPKKIDPITEKGDVALIGGRAFPRSIADKRKALEERINRQGFDQTMEAMAYTWFNRLVAIRYMELHGYLEHGYRILSHPEGKSTPEILEHAEHLDFPGLDKATVIALKLEGTKESELYRMLLTAQCNGLHRAMPFLFEHIDDETELLLPDNLLHSNSLIRKLVNEIPEDDWQEVEIIGWLYQFYISEKKDEVIGKVVASEDIPAATQLFTPNWIVKYLVQNTLGRQWLATYPRSSLRQQMEYYIEPAEQTPEVQEQLKAITPNSLNPEEQTLLDPACGSGHILVEAYDLFKGIYQERGYRAKDIPALILQKNLFGLEIDDRAAQLAAFALMMKARADDRRIFDSEAKPNIVASQGSKGLNAEDITHALNSPINKEDVPQEYLFEEIQEEKDGLFSKKTLAEEGHVSQADIASLLELFQKAKTFGSLIQVPPKLAAKLPEIEKRLDEVLKFGDLTHASVHVLKPLLQQATLLTKHYDAVVANPPYMTSDNYNPAVKKFIVREYETAKADLCTCFIARGLELTKGSGYLSYVTMQNWMFIARFDKFRSDLIASRTLVSLAQLGSGAFPAIGGKVVQVAAFVALPCLLKSYRTTYLRLIEGTSQEKSVAFHAKTRFVRSSDFFTEIPAAPLLFWISDAVRYCLVTGTPLGDLAEPRCGMNTGDNARFVRYWHEVEHGAIGFQLENRDAFFTSGCRWVPYNKGGKYRRWYGNCDSVLRFDKPHYDILSTIGNKLPSRDFYFKRSLTWSKIGDAVFAVRCSDKGFVFDGGGSSAFPPDEWYWTVGGFLCSKVAHGIIKALNPTVNFQSGDVAALPLLNSPLLQRRGAINNIIVQIVGIARLDWDSSEASWAFVTLPILQHKAATIRVAQEAADAECLARFARMKELEEENNRLFIEAYGLQDELSPEVPDDQITLNRPDRQEDIKRLLSYAIGCMMGRYSLDKLGLIYAHSGNQDFDHNQYKTFRADDDGIILLLETDWGIRDDATNRIVEFVGVAWPKKHLDENLKFIADSLGPNNGEQPRETIRRYLATGFYKHHLSMYKKRPIYWLFSSGKQQAFQCLIYLHRYHEGTLARMRTEYVIPLQGLIGSRLQQLEDDKVKATSTSHLKTLQKEQDNLKKQQAELLIFEEKLKHAADQKISLDLDDGVKVNYGKFGSLLAEVKAVTGGSEDE